MGKCEGGTSISDNLEDGRLEREKSNSGIIIESLTRPELSIPTCDVVWGNIYHSIIRMYLMCHEIYTVLFT